MSKLSLNTSKEAGFAHILVLLAVLATTGLIASSNIKTTKEFSGSLAQSVLGEDENKTDEQVKEASQKAVEQQKEAQQKQQEEQKKNEQKTTESVKVQSEGSKQETEFETASGQKIKAKVEDNGNTKVEIEQGKLKYTKENGKVKIEGENEASKEAELDELENEAENDLEKEGIKISTESGQPVITKNRIAARTSFPLSIDVSTKQLIVTTPAGQKAVTVLPDAAVQNLIAAKVISEVENQATSSGLAAKLGNLTGEIKLEMRGNEMVYRINGIKIHKLLGFIPVSTSTTAFVSAESGNLVAQDQSLLTNLINLLSR